MEQDNTPESKQNQWRTFNQMLKKREVITKMYIDLCASENKVPSNAEFEAFKIEMEAFATHWAMNEDKT